MSAAADERELLTSALRGARDTKLLELDRGANRRTGEAFASLFGSSPALVIADENTFAAAGPPVLDSLRSVGQACDEPFILPAVGMYAEYKFVDQIRDRIQSTAAIPVAVGAGTINDLVKLAAFQCGRKYLSVATAASMDGYTAYGSSITKDGLKQTFDCPAPLGVVADLDVIAEAPEGLNASGYADLAAKMPAGADWIAADFLGEEPIDRPVWNIVQPRLRAWMANPAGIRERDLDSLRRTTVALMMSGFAMQTALTSRVASGAEHQFSHLWDMEGHKHNGKSPSHGFKVAIGSLASIGMYEALARLDPGSLDIDRAVDVWPDSADIEAEIAGLFAQGELAEKAREESGVKHMTREALRWQLETLKHGWPQLERRLSDQLYSRDQFRDMLREAGAAYESPQIGISPERLRRSYRQAYHIRRRFTVLDVARRSGLFEPALDLIFERNSPPVPSP